MSCKTLYFNSYVKSMCCRCHSRRPDVVIYNHFLVWEWGGGGGEENVYDFDRKKFLTLFLAKYRYFVHGLKFVLNDSVKKTLINTL